MGRWSEEIALLPVLAGGWRPLAGPGDVRTDPNTVLPSSSPFEACELGSQTAGGAAEKNTKTWQE